MGQKELEEIAAKVASGQACMIDCREKSEWDRGHLAGARLVPLSALRRGEVPADLPAQIPLYVHCYRGGRTREAALLLSSCYPLVEALACEYDDLIAAHFPVEGVIS